MAKVPERGTNYDHDPRPSREDAKDTKDAYFKPLFIFLFNYLLNLACI